MLTTRIIPCLDVDAGRVVKGVKFQNLRDAGDPAQLAARYEAEGADEIVILDVSATSEGRETAVNTVERVRAAIRIPLTVGGGVRTNDDARLLLEAGADRVSVNSAAVAEPALVARMAERFGVQCVVVAIDAAGSSGRDVGRWEVVVKGGRERTGIDAIVWASQVASLGAGEILLTSFDRDGTGEGYDTDLIAAVSTASKIPVIASGGASGPEHMALAVRAGADAVLAASIFHDGVYAVAQVKRELKDAGLEVRL
ncbi:MAG: imidazole glycerol phosphate synthase subunit HisF [Phycisphaerales bacterium]|nr:imidazole glycerol phosphate synthase subunit HisF [Phycisphaerales bacterium]